jgi:CRP/FNR family cyclic AMP-dependent transcriptional regulator
MNPTPGRIIAVYNEGGNRIGQVEFDGKRRAIYLNLVPEAQVGDDVLFHAGFATERVEPQEARPTERQSAGGGMDGRSADLETDHAYRLLSELDPQQLRKLIHLALDKQYAAGDIIFPSGATSSFLHLIVSGEVALEAVTDGQKLQVQSLRAGDAMGWSAITGDALTHFEARALSPVSTIAFPGDQLRMACEGDPAMGYALMKRLVELASERLDQMRLKLADIPDERS